MVVKRYLFVVLWDELPPLRVLLHQLPLVGQLLHISNTSTLANRQLDVKRNLVVVLRAELQEKPPLHVLLHQLPLARPIAHSNYTGIHTVRQL